jgi:hypothetical protein
MSACKSTVNDLLILYDAWMESATAQKYTGASGTADSPFKRVLDTRTSNIDINEESGYGFGCVVTQLPAKVGLVGINGYECPELPVAARGSRPQPLIYHQGSVTGSLSAVYLFPETHSAIIVLGNSFDLTDTPDWISQLLLEELDAPERNDFVELAKKTAANAVSHHQPTIERLAREQEKGTKARQFSEYCGRYYNGIGNFFLEFEIFEDGLHMFPQGLQDSSYVLHHYHHDVFAWPCDRECRVQRGSLSPACNRPAQDFFSSRYRQKNHKVHLAD